MSYVYCKHFSPRNKLIISPRTVRWYDVVNIAYANWKNKYPSPPNINMYIHIYYIQNIYIYYLCMNKNLRKLYYIYAVRVPILSSVRMTLFHSSSIHSTSSYPIINYLASSPVYFSSEVTRKRTRSADIPELEILIKYCSQMDHHQHHRLYWHWHRHWLQHNVYTEYSDIHKYKYIIFDDYEKKKFI